MSGQRYRDPFSRPWNSVGIPALRPEEVYAALTCSYIRGQLFHGTRAGAVRHIEANVEEERFALGTFAEEDARLLPGALDEASISFEEIDSALDENFRLRVGGGVVEDRLRRHGKEAEMSRSLMAVRS